MNNDFLVFDHVTKRFGALTAVNDVCLTVNKGEFFSLLGPSGCGKTTLLRMLGGFERPDSGRIYLEGKDITDLPPNQRRVHTVFQNYALFPTMTIWDNIAFSLKLAKKPKAEIEERVDEILEMIQLSDQAWKYPNQLSGGQKQRVAIARALVDRPQVLLLDEPLAALDLKLRQHMLLELDTIHDQVGITFLYVTHDQGEAMSLSDRIAVINRGKIEQLDVPAKIYEAPSSRFVASFIGDTNFFSGEIATVDGEYCYINVEGFPQVKAFNDKNLQVGQKVDQGEIVAFVGATGTATGPHLDFRVMKNGRFVNPDTLSGTRSDPVSKQDRARFMQTVASVRSLLDSDTAVAEK